MYQITIKGNRKAARIAMQNMIGYGDPDILAEDEGNEYSVCFEFTTKYDDDPFHPGFSSPAIWNGEKEDLSRFDDSELAAGNYYLCYNGKGYDGAFLSGLLDLDIEMLQKPDDPFWTLQLSSCGTCGSQISCPALSSSASPLSA